MSRPSAGNYHIYNRLLSTAGERLAITFHGENQFVTIEPFAEDNNDQVWILQDYDANTQTLVPFNATGLQAACGDQAFIKVMSAGDYVWVIRSGDEGYTIQDGGRTANWSVEEGDAGEKVSIIDDQSRVSQRWIFGKVGEEDL